jgi:hypothetical protein
VTFAQRVFTLDIRSLAVMRIAVAIAILVDLGTRLVHLTAHYSDDGVLPRSIARTIDGFSDVSLLAISGSPIWAGVVFAIGFVLAAALLVGYRTRLVTLGLWLVVLSIQHRNPLLSDHRDVLFSCALLYGLLLPWGAAFAMDARRDPPTTLQYSGVPAAAYVVLIGSLYLCSALLKTGPEWRSDFTAVTYAVGLEYWATSNARWLLDHPTLAQLLTIGVLVFEAAVAPLLLSPWRTRLLRWVVVIGLALLQLGFAIFLWLDTFPMISAAITLGLLPWPRSAPPAITEPARWRSGIAAALIVYTLVLDVVSLSRDDDSVVRRPAQLLGVDQNWSMFAPSPSRLDGWFLVAALRPDGTYADLMTGDPLTFERPASFRAGIQTTRELVYHRRLLGYDAAREPFARQRCRTAKPAPVVVILYFVAVTDGRLAEPEALVTVDCP